MAKGRGRLIVSAPGGPPLECALWEYHPVFLLVTRHPKIVGRTVWLFRAPAELQTVLQVQDLKYFPQLLSLGQVTPGSL